LAEFDIEVTLWRRHMDEDCLIYGLCLTFVGALMMGLESERLVKDYLGMPYAHALVFEVHGKSSTHCFT